jgi:DNA repair exonuclease SbcCD ATPase subunit
MEAEMVSDLTLEELEKFEAQLRGKPESEITLTSNAFAYRVIAAARAHLEARKCLCERTLCGLDFHQDCPVHGWALQPPQQREDDDAERLQREWDQSSAIMEEIGAGPLPGASPAPSSTVSDDAGLVERLRGKYAVVESEPTLCDEAADALEAKDAQLDQAADDHREHCKIVEAKDAEIERLEKLCRTQKAILDQWQPEREETQAEIERLREALENIQTWCKADPDDNILAAIDGAARAALKGGD